MPAPLSAGSPREITPETLTVLAAAVTAFLGKKVRVRAARVLQTPYSVERWARQGRVMIQSSHNLIQRGR